LTSLSKGGAFLPRTALAHTMHMRVIVGMPILFGKLYSELASTTSTGHGVRHVSLSKAMIRCVCFAGGCPNVVVHVGRILEGAPVITHDEMDMELSPLTTHLYNVVDHELGSLVGKLSDDLARLVLNFTRQAKDGSDVAVMMTQLFVMFLTGKVCGEDTAGQMIQNKVSAKTGMERVHYTAPDGFLKSSKPYIGATKLKKLPLVQRRTALQQMVEAVDQALPAQIPALLTFVSFCDHARDVQALIKLVGESAPVDEYGFGYNMRCLGALKRWDLPLSIFLSLSFSLAGPSGSASSPSPSCGTCATRPSRTTCRRRRRRSDPSRSSWRCST